MMYRNERKKTTITIYKTITTLYYTCNKNENDTLYIYLLYYTSPLFPGNGDALAFDDIIMLFFNSRDPQILETYSNTHGANVLLLGSLAFSS